MLIIGLIPLQHGRAEFNTRALAVGFDDALRVIEDIIGIYDGDIALGHYALFVKVVEQLDELDVASLTGIVVLPAGDVLAGRHGAAPVGGDGAARVADEECPVELAQDVKREDCWVAGLGDAAEGLGDGGWAGVGGEDVLGHIFDEDAFALGVLVGCLGR